MTSARDIMKMKKDTETKTVYHGNSTLTIDHNVQKNKDTHPYTISLAHSEMKITMDIDIDHLIRMRDAINKILLEEGRAKLVIS